MNIEDLLDRRAIAPRLVARTKRQALAQVAETAARRFGLDAGETLDALLAREAAGSTGVGAGVAVPHAKLEGLDAMKAVFVRLDAPVDYDAVDGQPVDLLFALFAPPDAGADHLRALARVARLLRQSELREQLRHAHTADAIYAILAQPARTSAA